MNNSSCDFGLLEILHVWWSSHIQNLEEGSVVVSGVARCGVHLLSKKKGLHAEMYKATTSKQESTQEGRCVPFWSYLIHGTCLLVVPNRRCKMHITQWTSATLSRASQCQNKQPHGSKEELELQQLMANAGCDPLSTACTLSECTGNLFTSQQIRYLSQKEQSLVTGLTADATSADKLVAFLFQQRWDAYLIVYMYICLWYQFPSALCISLVPCLLCWLESLSPNSSPRNLPPPMVTVPHSYDMGTVAIGW